MRKLIVLALLICFVGSVFAAENDTGTYRIFVTAIGAPYHQVSIDGLTLSSIYNVGTFVYEDVTPGYHDVGVQLLDFDFEPLGGASSQTKYNVYVAKDQIKNVFFNFDSV